jgi:hypothetical protein
MKIATAYLETLDAGRDHREHAAFTRLVEQSEAPVHSADLKPILTWVCGVLDQLGERVVALERRQDPEHHNPEPTDGA